MLYGVRKENMEKGEWGLGCYAIKFGICSRAKKRPH